MGFKYDDKGIKCPLFKRVVRTTNGQFVGVICADLPIDLGFEVSYALRFRTSEDLKEYLEVFCKDGFEECPYYRINQKSSR